MNLTYSQFFYSKNYTVNICLLKTKICFLKCMSFNEDCDRR